VKQYQQQMNTLVSDIHKIATIAFQKAYFHSSAIWNKHFQYVWCDFDRASSL